MRNLLDWLVGLFFVLNVVSNIYTTGIPIGATDNFDNSRLGEVVEVVDERETIM